MRHEFKCTELCYSRAGVRFNRDQPLKLINESRYASGSSFEMEILFRFLELSILPIRCALSDGLLRKEAKSKLAIC